MKDRVRVIKADITTMALDAIVNAANKSLLGGGGVDGAIHAAAGPALREACRKLGGCETGEAKMTPAFGLPCRFVIHTVGPIWRGGNQDEDAQLIQCYRHTLSLAKKHGLRRIGFPSISTGAYGFPLIRAAAIAAAEVRSFLVEHPDSLDEVVHVCFSETDREAYQRAVDAVWS